MRISLKSTLIASAIACLPFAAAAEVLELSQGQMRQLVAQQQVVSAETIATSAVSEFDGVVIDIRGFLSEGRMTYRLLLQREDGSVIMLLYNGTDGRRISHNSPMGQVVTAASQANGGGANLPANANANAIANANENAGNRGNARGRGDSGDRGNSGNSGRSSGRGN